MQGFENTRPEYAGPEFVGPNVGAGKKIGSENAGPKNEGT